MRTPSSAPGHGAWTLTVPRSWSSSPRPKGAWRPRSAPRGGDLRALRGGGLRGPRRVRRPWACQAAAAPRPAVGAVRDRGRPQSLPGRAAVERRPALLVDHRSQVVPAAGLEAAASDRPGRRDSRSSGCTRSGDRRDSPGSTGKRPARRPWPGHEPMPRSQATSTMFCAARPRSHMTDSGASAGARVGRHQGDGQRAPARCPQRARACEQSLQRRPVADDDELPALEVLGRPGATSGIQDRGQVVVRDRLVA